MKSPRKTSGTEAENTGGTPKKWKKPHEVLKLQLIKQRQNKLQARLNQNPKNETSRTPEKVTNSKRKNPFSRTRTPKKQKSTDEIEGLNPEDTIFQLLQSTEVKPETNIDTPVFEKFEYIEQETEAEEEAPPNPFLPMDWSVKSRIRFLCQTQIPGTNLKTNQESSGLTGFVRCIDDSSSTGLDISPGAKFHQSTLYWQHPSLPWLNLYPRNSRANHGFQIGEAEAKALARDWADSFRSLFQLVRSRQCSYFYVCANTFTVLFRAAGIGGREETHALISPTTRGMRAALKQEDIEFTQPLKPVILSKTKSPGASFSNSSEDTQPNEEEEEEESDEDDEKWLESLGVDAQHIKQINNNFRKKQTNEECEGDFSEQSLALIEGVDCQALFNYLLNSSKSTIAKVGRLANIPPTLLAPVAFQGATLRNLSAKSSKIRYDGNEYYSMEVKGVILPHVLPYVMSLLSETKDCFTATLTTVQSTLAFTKATEKLVLTLPASDQVFGRENLSDCGLAPYIVDSMCRSGTNAVRALEQVRFVRENEKIGFVY